MAIASHINREAEHHGSRRVRLCLSGHDNFGGIVFKKDGNVYGSNSKSSGHALKRRHVSMGIPAYTAIVSCLPWQCLEAEIFALLLSSQGISSSAIVW